MFRMAVGHSDDVDLTSALEDRYRLSPHSSVELKGKGLVETCFLLGRRLSATGGRCGL